MVSALVVLGLAGCEREIPDIWASAFVDKEYIKFKWENLRGKLTRGARVKESAIDLVNATLATVGSYNLAGEVCGVTDFGMDEDAFMLHEF